MRQGGSVNGAPLPVFTPTPTHAFPNQPGDSYYNDVQGTVEEHPVNPKFGLSYQVTPNDLVYATASKGYRAGNVNPAGTYTQCAPDLAAIGRPTPLTYTSDAVWSYEGGAKLRLFDRMQLNSSLYYIDWQDPQLTVRLQCGFTYVTNAKHAVSKGGDIDTQIRVIGGLTLNGSVSYTNAYYTDDFSFPNPSGGTTYIVKKGGSLGIPVWQFNVGGQYDFELMNRFASYVRVDYQYASDYQRGSAAGTVGYVAQTVYGAPTHYMTARAGMRFDGYEASLFVNNLTDSHDILNEAVGAQSPLTTASTYRPREVGLQLSYRF